MTINYNDIKSSLSPEQRALIEGKKKVTKKREKPEPTVQVTNVTSSIQGTWLNCENRCMGWTSGPLVCDMCGGRMIPGNPL